MNRTDLHSSLLFLMLKLEEAKSNPMLDKNFVVALTEVLRYFRDNGELKKAYESQKDSLADLANSSLTKALKDYVSSKNQEDGVDTKLPDIDELIKELASDEFIEKKIKDILGDNDVDNDKEVQSMIRIHKLDFDGLYSICGFFIDPNKDVWVSKKQLMELYKEIERIEQL